MSAADDIKNKLREAIMRNQPQIIETGETQSLSGEAENSLRNALLEFFNAANPPSAVVTPFSGMMLMSLDPPDTPDPPDPDTPVTVPVFKYGSGDGDDIIGLDANDIDTELFVKSCTPNKGYILLVFSIEDLFRRCMRYTLMKSRVVDFQTQNQGEHLANLIALTEDEFEFFCEDFLYNAAIAVHSIIGAFGRNTGVRSMVFNPGTVLSPGTVIYALQIPEKGFFHNYVLQLYENIQSALYYSVLQQWAQWCNDAGEIQANALKYSARNDAVMAFRNIGCPRTKRPSRYY
jgi:hypothetical protein